MIFHPKFSDPDPTQKMENVWPGRTRRSFTRMTGLTRPLLGHQGGSTGALSRGTSEFPLFSPPSPPPCQNWELLVDSKSVQDWPLRSCLTPARLARPLWHPWRLRGGSNMGSQKPQNCCFRDRSGPARTYQFWRKKKSLPNGSGRLAVNPRLRLGHLLQPLWPLGQFEDTPFSVFFT
jgi:hypothetical protein